MQHLWRNDYDWDVELPADVRTEWERLAEDLSNLSCITLSRDICLTQESDLHVFADASSVAYGAAAYLVSNGTTNLIFAKARVAPIKSVTLLHNSNLGSRILKYVLGTFDQEVRFKTVRLWSDSKVALSWLKTENKISSFVASRVNEIKMNTNLAKFSHVKGTDNPADHLTRGIPLEKT